MKRKVTVKDAAILMHKAEMFVRIGLQRGSLPIGIAIKTSSKYSYYINPKLLEEYLGVDLEEELVKNEKKLCTIQKEKYNI